VSGRIGGAFPPRVLVVGCGFLGERFAAIFAARGAEVRVLTRSEPGPRKRSVIADAELMIADAGDRAAVEEALKGTQHVVYTAGGLMPAESDRKPEADAELSFRPLLSVLDALRSRREISLTYVSSGGTIYGQPEYLPVDERHPTNPISAYGVLRLACEKFVSMHCERDRIPVRILRCANAYGEHQPAQRGQGAVAAFVDRVMNDEPIVVYGDGQIVRDFIYVDDIVEALVALIGGPPGPMVVNVGSGLGHSLNDLIGIVEDVSGRRMAVERRPPREFDVSEIVLDISRLRALVDFKPTPLEEGVRRMIESTAVAAVGRVGASDAPRSAAR
jgi:UDP-glucose 4-epimerase